MSVGLSTFKDVTVRRTVVLHRLSRCVDPKDVKQSGLGYWGARDAVQHHSVALGIGAADAMASLTPQRGRR